MRLHIFLGMFFKVIYVMNILIVYEENKGKL